jgi:hypothetical protein
MRGRPVTDQERALIIAQARAGKPYSWIAVDLARPIGTVKRAIADAVLCGVLERRRTLTGGHAAYNAFHNRHKYG